MTSRSVVVLIAGDPVLETRRTRGSFADLIRDASPAFSSLDWTDRDVRELDVLPALTDALAVIVTGSASSVTEATPWMSRTAERLRELVRAEVPLLGICFGHQLMAEALGGRVTKNPRGREMGTVRFTLSSTDPVLGERGSWPVSASHLDSVVEVPGTAELLGFTALEPHAAVRFGPRAWGVQFHPEIDASVMRQYLDARSDALVVEGFDPAALARGVQETPQGAQVIENFLRFAVAARG